ncbi:MAG: polymerase sigma-70 factor [Mucilaginibacter sp.]|nr:polymerase sigma-70 factor [Mucilaginibacter sp.]
MLRELTYTIETEVRQLPDKCRSIYELSRSEHKTNGELAIQLGISEKTVENHLTKALKVPSQYKGKPPVVITDLTI